MTDRSQKTAYSFTYGDLERVAGRSLTDEEVARIVRALANSTIGECVDGAVEQVAGWTETMTDDDGTTYQCGPTACGYQGATYCQNCGYAVGEFEAWL